MISKIQTMRKDAGFEVMDHIRVSVNDNNRLAEIVSRNQAAIAEKVLADEILTQGALGISREWNVNGENVTIDLYIVAQYGVRIPELAWESQENVKNNVETMTGLNVLKVNIHIEGVSFDKEKTEQP